MNKINLLKILFLFLVSLVICKCFYTYIKGYNFSIYEGHGNFDSSGQRISGQQSGIKCECGLNCEECDPNTSCGEGSLGCHNHNPQGGHSITTVGAGAVAPSNVQPSQVSDTAPVCQGSWSNCNINCARQWTTASGQPSNCIQPQSSSAPVCNPGDDECPSPPPSVPDVDCLGGVSQCTAACETADQRTVNVIVAQSGNGLACPVPTDCQPGDGQCAAAPPAPAAAPTWHLGGWGETNCNAVCGRIGKTCGFPPEGEIITQSNFAEKIPNWEALCSGRNGQSNSSHYSPHTNTYPYAINWPIFSQHPTMPIHDKCITWNGSVDQNGNNLPNLVASHCDTTIGTLRDGGAQTHPLYNDPSVWQATRSDPYRDSEVSLWATPDAPPSRPLSYAEGQAQAANLQATQKRLCKCS
jgi:hypothetical protein